VIKKSFLILGILELLLVIFGCGYVLIFAPENMLLTIPIAMYMLMKGILFIGYAIIE